jgi:ArsR family transcriptional regulator
MVYMTTATHDALLLPQLKALADPTRLAILRLLRSRGCCSIDKRVGLCACDIEARVKLSQPTVSHHMAVLTRAGLVEGQKVGQWMWYRRKEDALRRLAQALQQEL